MEMETLLPDHSSLSDYKFWFITEAQINESFKISSRFSLYELIHLANRSVFPVAFGADSNPDDGPTATWKNLSVDI